MLPVRGAIEREFLQPGFPKPGILNPGASPPCTPGFFFACKESSAVLVKPRKTRQSGNFRKWISLDSVAVIEYDKE